MTLSVVVVSLGVVCWMICHHGADGGMSAWKDITQCNAKPCKCYDKRERCYKGSKMQMRVCEYDGIDFLASLAACKDEFEAEGTIRTKTCWNKKKRNNNVCPGWSDWEITSECERNDDGNWTQTQERLCNNPPPLHPKVLCKMTNGLQAKREQDDELPCEPEESPVEVTTQEMSTGADLPCCEDINNIVYPDDYDSNGINVTVQLPAATTMASAEGTIAPLSDDEQDYLDKFYDDDPPCRNCTASTDIPITTEFP